jgi:hypothetical protein
LTGREREHKEQQPAGEAAHTAREMATQSGIGAEIANARGGIWLLGNRLSSPGPGTSYVHGGWGEPIRPGGGSLSRKRYIQYVEHNRKGHCEDTNNGGGAVS